MEQILLLCGVLQLTLNNVFANLPCVEKEFPGGMVCVCNSTHCDTIEPVEKVPVGQFIYYTSSKAGLRLKKRNGTFIHDKNANKSGILFEINRFKKYQTIYGFGGAFTDSAGINILGLSQGTQDNLLRSYFSEDGIEYNFGRVPIGGTDFSTRKYTLDDTSSDVLLKNFSLAEEDFKYKIPIIKRAQAISKKKINLLGTAWTAPPWMKTNNDYSGYGFLKKEYYHIWAMYHMKFLEAYDKEGLQFWGITTGNEPLNGFVPFVVRFNSMGWYPTDHGEWIGEHLGPMLRTSQFNKTKIISHDDQRILVPEWIYKVMSNKKAAQYIDGFGLHWYWDFIIPVSVVSEVHNSFPGKFIMNTEASIGDKPWETKVVPGSWYRGQRYVNDIIEDINSWMSAWLEWNLALDIGGGPNWSGNFVDAPILVNEEKDEFYKQPMFYALGHFSKFIKSGAERISISSQQKKSVKILAILNPDNSTVIVLHNIRKKPVMTTIMDQMRGQIDILLDPYSFNTIIYW